MGKIEHTGTPIDRHDTERRDGIYAANAKAN
jgi:hypothetical protein